MTGRFEGRVALVTGAGSGIGRAITVRLTGEGASVFAVDIDGSRLKDIDGSRQKDIDGSRLEDGPRLKDGSHLKETVGLAPGPVTVHQTDLSDPGACTNAVQGCVEEFGRLDMLGNVAGIYLPQHLSQVTLEQYRRVMGVNLDAYFFLCQAAVPHLLDVGGNIVNIASNAGLQGVPYSSVYCMSKGGVIQLTRALAVEFLKTPLRVNAIAPAGTNTNIATSVEFPPDMDPDLARRMGGLRGMAEPEEVAALFAFLASDDARSITGAVYTLDNGLTAS